MAVRRAVLPEHLLAFDEPAAGTRAATNWPAILGTVLPVAAPTGLVLRSARADGMAEVVAATRAAAAVAQEAAASLGPLRPRGPALTMARATVAAAVATLERVAGERLAVDPRRADRRRRRGRLGADAVVERGEAFDPLANGNARG